MALSQTYHLEMVPISATVDERTSATIPYTPYSITASGQHGFSWGSNLEVILSADQTIRGGRPAGYLDRKAHFTVQLRAVTSDSQIPGSVTFNITYVPSCQAHVLFGALGSSANARATVYSLDGLKSWQDFSNDATEDSAGVTGESEVVTKTFLANSWTQNGTGWVSSYQSIPVYYGPYCVTGVTPPSGGNQSATASATGTCSFSAPDVVQ